MSSSARPKPRWIASSFSRSVVTSILIAMLALYFVSTEQGAVSLFDGKAVHEFVHDGRHLLGFPCH